jgi:hypothetical protein
MDFMDILAAGQNVVGLSRSQEYYLIDPLAAFTDSAFQYNMVDLGELDIAHFEQRFSLLWDTF